MLLLICAWLPAQTSVLTYHYDNNRSGLNSNETILTPANVGSPRFGRLFSQPVDGFVYAQPLYVPHLAIPGKGTHNVVFVATEGDSVYAFDADSSTGANAKPLWHASLIDARHGAALGATPVNMLAQLRCDAIIPVVGTTSTPVIDLGTGTIYVESFSKEGNRFVHRLHALDIARGTEKSPGRKPVEITASVPAEGAGNTNRIITFDALHHLNRPGLLLVNGIVYLAYSSHCDRPPAHGWVFAYDAATLAQKSVFITTPNGFFGGIWMSGAAPAADSSGNIFLTTGNGSFDPAAPGTELSDAVLKLALQNGKLSALDYFIPYNYLRLNRHDQDLSAGGVLLLPDQSGSHKHLLAIASKEGTIYLLDRDQMTAGNQHLCGKECTSDTQIVQEIPNAFSGMFGMPAYWNNTLYFCGNNEPLKAFSLRDGRLSATPSSSSRETYQYPGAVPSVSSNGNTNGIVWTLATDAYESNGPAVLRAYDASNVSHTLYASNVRSGDSPGGAVKFSVPVVVNGKVYVGAAGRLSVYGLLDREKLKPQSTRRSAKVHRSLPVV